MGFSFRNGKYFWSHRHDFNNKKVKTMNYQKVYDQLVQKNHEFSEGEYFETHHKVPLSLGGNDEKSNLVNLTAREHYIAHLLLVKITEQNNDT